LISYDNDTNPLSRRYHRTIIRAFNHTPSRPSATAAGFFFNFESVVMWSA
jgi:hypothetical protein